MLQRVPLQYTLQIHELVKQSRSNQTLQRVRVGHNHVTVSSDKISNHYPHVHGIETLLRDSKACHYGMSSSAAGISMRSVERICNLG